MTPGLSVSDMEHLWKNYRFRTSRNRWKERSHRIKTDTKEEPLGGKFHLQKELHPKS